MKNIKVSLLCSDLHKSKEFDKERQSFIDSIAKSGNFNISVCELDDYEDCDLKLIFIASGGSESLFLDNIYHLQEPYYILTNGSNNSLAASLEILTYLNNNNLKGEVLHGTIEYIVDRINELTSVKEVEPVKLGVIGRPSDWLISSIPDYQLIKNKYGIELVKIPLVDLIDDYKNKEIINTFNCDYFSNKELSKADAFYDTCKKFVEMYNLKGFTIRCFDLLFPIRSTGCMALAKLNSEGIVACCEGDVMAMITMYVVREKFNSSSFQCNPSRIDVENNRIVLAHCTCPLDMLTNYKYDTHFESKIGVAIKGELKEEDVTIFRLSSDLKSYYVGEGKIIRNLNEKDLCRTQIEVQMYDDISILLRKPCGNHHIVFYGKHKKELLQILEELY